MTSASASVGQGKSVDSVVQKVIEMLQANKVKVAEDLAAEEKEAAAYSEFCDTEIEEKGYAIKTAVRKISELDAVVADAKAQIAAADSEIAALGTEMAGKSADLASATAGRGKEAADFKTTEATLVGSVGQLEKAIVLLKRETALLQSGAKPDPKAQARALSLILGKVIDAAWVDHGSASVLKGFLQEQGETTSDAEELNLLKGKTTTKTHTKNSILETLGDMKEKAEETLSGVRMTEMKAAHNFDMMKQSITDQLTLCSEKLSDQKSLVASLTEAMGKANGENAEVAKTKMADTVYVSTLTSECKEAADAWTEKQASGKAEMAAIEKAKSILSERVKVFFVQTGAKDPNMGAENDDEKTAVVRSKLVTQLKSLGHKLNSYAMMELASSAAADPFEKIKGLISDMVAKLISEANEEASQKSFCDEEKAKSAKEQEEKSMRSDDLQSRLDTASSAKAARLQDIKDLQTELAELDASVASSTELRAAEHATYLKTSADFKGAAAAVEEAIHVLKEFYASSFIQVKGKASSENDSIIAILENSGAEFTKMYMEAETAETAAVDAFKKLSDEAKVTKAAKTAEVSAAESEIKSLEVAIQNGGEDLKMVTKELDAVMAYIEKLKPQCEVKVMTYEEKKAKREAEISGLKEALSILEAPALLQLRGTKRH